MYTMIVIGNDPKLSKRVQLMLFKAGFKWALSDKNPAHIDAPFLFAASNGELKNANYEPYTICGSDLGANVYIGHNLTQAVVNSFPGAKPCVELTVREISNRLGIPNLKIIPEKS